MLANYAWNASTRGSFILDQETVYCAILEHFEDPALIDMRESAMPERKVLGDIFSRRDNESGVMVRHHLDLI